LKSAQRKLMARLQAKRSINATLGTKSDGVSGLLSAFGAGKKKNASTKVAPEAQVEELRKANATLSTISNQKSNEVDFNWGEDDDEAEHKILSDKLETKDLEGPQDGHNENLISSGEDLKRMEEENTKRANQIRAVFKSQALSRAKAQIAAKRMLGGYGNDNNAISSARTNLQKALVGKSIKNLQTEISNIKANPKVLGALKKDVGQAEMVLRSKTDDLVHKLEAAMNDKSNPKQKEMLENILDDVTALGITGHDDLIQNAVEKLIHLEHLKKLQAMIANLNQRTIAEIKSFKNPHPMLVIVIQCVLLFIGQSEQDVENWKLCCKWLGKTGKLGLKRRISGYNVGSVSDATMAIIIPKMKKVNIDDVANQSKGVATIYAWLVGMMSERKPDWNT
jgi:hypothetical protein